MKKFLLSFALIAAGLIVTDTASAQCAKSASANKSCCASKASTTSVDNVKTNDVILTAMAEQGVKKSVCETTGSVSYHIETAAPDGSVASTQEVAFDEQLGKFVNTAPAKACCAKGSAEAKACEKKETETGKACCASKAEKSTK